MEANTPVICRQKKQESFFTQDWTAQISLIRLDKFAFTRAPIFGFVGRISQRVARTRAR
jgi:hypothetical protein